MSGYGQSFYGDTMRWFIGVVEEVGSDVPRLGRVKVRIHGVHADASLISVADLPYAQVLIPTTEGGVSGIGQNPNLMPGAQVFGIFLDGKSSQLPLVLGSIPKVEVPSREQVDNIITKPYAGAINQQTEQGISAAYFHKISANPQSSFLSQAWEYFTIYDYPPVAIAGILGNFWVESFGDKKGDLDPEATNGIAVGLAQWEGTRLDELKLFAEKNPQYGTHLSFFMQLEWVREELKNEYKSALGVKLITDVANAAVFWQHRYERNAFAEDNGKKIPSKYTVQNIKINKRLHEDRRIYHAERIYRQFTGKAST